MEVLYIVLNDTDHLEGIFEKFLELGVKGATVLDSQGMAASILSYATGMSSLLSGPFSQLGKDYDPNSKTIFTVLKNHEMAERVAHEIRNLLKNTDKKVIGFMFTMPVTGIYTLSNED